MSKASVAWPFGTGEMARLLRAYDWSATQLGPLESWSVEIKAVVSLTLASPTVSSLALTPERLLIYNDLAARLYGTRHPAALGRPLRETFPDSYPSVAALYDRVFAGESVSVSAQPLAVGTENKSEVFDAYLTPVRGVDGAVLGVQMVGFEVGDRIRNEARLRESEELRRIAVEGGRMGTWQWNLRDGSIWGDAAFLELWGFPSSDEPRQLSDFTKRMSAEGQAEMGDMVTRAVAAGEAFDGQLAVVGGPTAGRLVRWRGRAEGERPWIVNGVSFDVTSERQVEQQQSFLLELSDGVRPLADPAQIQGETTRRLREHLNAGWCYYVEWDFDKKIGRVLRDATRKGLPSLVGEHDVSDAPEFLELLLAAGDVLTVSDYVSYEPLSPRIRNKFNSLGFRSMMVAPLVKKGRLLASLLVGDTEIRAWEGIAPLLAETAERTWAAVERARAETALRQSEARLAAAFESVPVGLAAVELSGEATFANAEYRRFIPSGVIPSRDPANVKRWRGWHSSGRLLEPENFPGARALRGETVVPGQEMLYVDDMGREIWTSIATSPTHDEAGQVTGMVSVISNIDFAKRSADALLKSEERQAFLLQLSDALRPLSDPVTTQTESLRLLVEHLGLVRAAYYEIDPDQNGMTLSASVETDRVMWPQRMAMSEFGADISETYRSGRTYAVSDADTDPRLTEQGRAAIRDGLGIRRLAGVPLVKERKLRIVLGVHAREPRDWRNDELELLREVADRTWSSAERARSAGALRQSEQNLHAVANIVPDLLWYSEPDGSTAWYNERWLEYTGKTFEQASVWGWVEAIHPDDREGSAARYREAVDQKKSLQQEHRIRRHTGEYRWFLVRSAPIRDDQGRITRMYGAATDIHDHRLAMEALRESEELRRLALESGGMGAWRWNIQEQVVQADDVVQELWGVQGLNEPHPVSVYGERMYADGAAWLEAATSGSNPSSGEFQTQLQVSAGPKAGHWVELRGRADRDNPWFINGVSFDVTSQRLEEKRQDFLLNLSDTLRGLEAPELIERTATRLLAEHMGVDRCHTIEVSPAQGLGWISAEHFTSDMPSLIGEYRYADFPTSMRRLETEPLIIHDLLNDASLTDADKQSIQAMGMQSALTTALHKGARETVWALNVGNRKPHHWSDTDRILVESVAERTWAAVERARAETALRESEERFRLFVENVREYALVQTDFEGMVTSWNPGAERLFGYTGAEVVGKPFSMLLPEEDKHEGIIAREMAVLSRGQKVIDARALRRKDGSQFWAEWVTEPVLDDAGSLRGTAKLIRDETDRQHAEMAIRESLAEKEELLKEVHHRVKNNLQVITSLVSLQSKQVTDERVQALFDETRNRIHSIAAIHERLYQSANFAQIGLLAYAREIVPELIRFYGAADRVRAVFQGAEANLELERAVPFGLLLNELVSNALKHAFRNASPGLIRINIIEEGATTRLLVADNGIGFPANFELEKSLSLGLKLSKRLAGQLGGNIAFHSDAGTVVEIQFPRMKATPEKFGRTV